MRVNRKMPDIACGLYQGERKNQQDAVESMTDVATGVSFIALSDGMGGAGFGNLASRLILRTAMSNLTRRSAEIAAKPAKAPEYLRNAAFAANRKLASFILDNPDKAGMGGTLVLIVLVGSRLFWLSIGDSLLYRFQKGELKKLNADHSLASGLDNLARIGQLDPRIAKSMAARSTLTSALMGQELKQIDCPKDGLAVNTRDLFVIASDGLDTLQQQDLSALLSNSSGQNAAQRVVGVIKAVEAVNASGQDNLAVSIASFA